MAHQFLALTILDGGFIKFTTGEVAEQMIGGFLTAAEIEELLLDGRFSGDVGWVGPNGKPFFENATVVYGAANWEPLVAAAPVDDRFRIGMEAVTAATGGTRR